MKANRFIALACAAGLTILADRPSAFAQDMGGNQGGWQAGNGQQGPGASPWQKSNASPNFGGMLPGGGRGLSGNGGGGGFGNGGMLQQLKQKFGSITPAGIGQGMGGMPGMGQGMPGMGQGMPGMGQGMPGMGQGMTGMGQGIPGMGQGMPGMGQGMPGMGQGMPGMGQGMPGMGQGMPGMGQGMPGMGQGPGGGRAAALMQQLRQRQAGGGAGGGFLQQLMQQRASGMGGLGGMGGRGTQRGSMIQQLQGGGGFGSFIKGRGMPAGMANRRTSPPMSTAAPSRGLPAQDDSLFKEWEATHPSKPVVAKTAAKKPASKAAPPAKKSSAK